MTGSYDQIMADITEITQSVMNMNAKIAYLEDRERRLKSQLEDAELRAKTYERRADEFENKADRTDVLEELCEKLIDAIERLPLQMSDAGMIPGHNPSDIALYGTYDWQHVVDAKHELKGVMKKG